MTLKWHYRCSAENCQCRRGSCCEQPSIFGRWGNFAVSLAIYFCAIWHDVIDAFFLTFFLSSFQMRVCSSTYISRVFIKTEMVLRSKTIIGGSKGLVHSRSSDNLPQSQSQVNINIQMISHTLSIREVSMQDHGSLTNPNLPNKTDLINYFYLLNQMILHLSFSAKQHQKKSVVYLIRFYQKENNRTLSRLVSRFLFRFTFFYFYFFFFVLFVFECSKLATKRSQTLYFNQPSQKEMTTKFCFRFTVSLQSKSKNKTVDIYS